MKTLWITGGSGDIGQAAALAFAKAGYAVAVGYHTAKNAALALVERLRREGCVAGAYGGDVARYSDVSAAAAQILQNFGHIDVLINCAGVSRPGLFTELLPQQYTQTIAVHLLGSMHTVHCVLPHMLSRKQGVILNVSSMWGQVGAACEVDYSAAKSGVIGMTKALAKEVGPSGVRVNCLAPGLIRSRINDCFSAEDLNALCRETPLRRMGAPEEMAQALLFLASDNAAFFTGQVFSPNGGLVL